MPVPAASPASGVKIGHQGCCSIADAGDARLVAAGLGIPFYVCNFKKDFGRIIDYFVDEYASGRTPNPCVRCNDWLKFGKLHEYATQVGAEFVASGHYARIGRGSDGSPRLLRGVDASKDQSYVLFGAPRERLASMMFPIGEFPKARVREMAREMGLNVFDKPDSQEICFVPDNDYAALVERKRPALRDTPGKVVDREGKVVGEHRGQHHYTIGQRRGLSVSLGHRIYVVSKDAETNTVVVGEDADLRTIRCVAGEANWLVDEPGEGAWREVMAKYRYNTPAVRARVRVVGPSHVATPSGRQGRFEVEFEESQAAVAPGQALVLYDAREPEWVVGGGWIEGVDLDRS
jgi:tRNA-specific 2-thiouridylase